MSNTTKRSGSIRKMAWLTVVMALLIAKGEFDKAIASFDEAIRLDPQIASMPFYKRYRAAAESLHLNPQNAKFAEEAQTWMRFRCVPESRLRSSHRRLDEADPDRSESFRGPQMAWRRLVE